MLIETNVIGILYLLKITNIVSGFFKSWKIKQRTLFETRCSNDDVIVGVSLE